MVGHRPFGVEGLSLAHDLPARQLLILQWRSQRREESEPTPRLPGDQGPVAGRAEPPSQLGHWMDAGLRRDEAPASTTLSLPRRPCVCGDFWVGGDFGIRGGVLDLSQRSAPPGAVQADADEDDRQDGQRLEHGDSLCDRPAIVDGRPADNLSVRWN